MPTIKFELRDQKKCDGCRFLDMNWTDIEETKITYDCVAKVFKNIILAKDKDFKRPQSCIDKFGE